MADYEAGVNVILGGSVGPRIRVALEEYAQRKGVPQWHIEVFRKLTIPDELIAGYGYPEFTDADKELVFGKNMAGLYGLDVDKLKDGLKTDKIAKASSALA